MLLIARSLTRYTGRACAVKPTKASPTGGGVPVRRPKTNQLSVTYYTKSVLVHDVSYLENEVFHENDDLKDFIDMFLKTSIATSD